MNEVAERKVQAKSWLFSLLAKIANGYTFKNGIKSPILEEGQVIENPEVADSLLPTQSGFFFGSNDYDQYYYDDIKHTRDELERILSDSNMEGDFYYHSSW